MGARQCSGGRLTSTCAGGANGRSPNRTPVATAVPVASRVRELGARGRIARAVNRGEIWTYRFRAPDKRRPVLVLSRQEVIPLLHTVMVAPVTSTRRGLPSEYRRHEGRLEDRLRRQSGSRADGRARQTRLVRRRARRCTDAACCRALAIATGCADWDHSDGHHPPLQLHQSHRRPRTGRPLRRGNLDGAPPRRSRAGGTSISPCCRPSSGGWYGTRAERGSSTGSPKSSAGVNSCAPSPRISWRS